MNSLFSITCIIWISSEILISVFMRSKAEDKKNQDKNSLTLLWITIAIAITAAVYISKNYYFLFSTFQAVKYIGPGLILTGVVFRVIVIITLGKYFTADVTIRKEHQLKKDGFYKYLRHPSYSASLLSFIGFGISLNNWVSLIIVVIPVLFAFIRRINVEEKALTDYFGQEYIDYKKSTYRLVPFIY
ncbi:MAG: isoprenylcysteine carboxylmethyltransferase family protein [Ginsengibacter sp.]